MLFHLLALSRKREHCDHIMHFIKHAAQIGQHGAANSEATTDSDERTISVEGLRRVLLPDILRQLPLPAMELLARVLYATTQVSGSLIAPR